MSPVATLSRSTPVRLPGRAALAAGVAIIALALSFGLLTLVRGPDFVDRVTVDNRTTADLRVDLVDGDGDLLALGVADARDIARVDDVIDPGTTWVFRVSRAGKTITTIRMTRAELAADGWRVVVPAEVEGRLDSGSNTGQ